jgi:hypothetical protein
MALNRLLGVKPGAGRARLGRGVPARLVRAALLACLALPVAHAQEEYAAAQAPVQAGTPYTTAQLDQMLAPIALYPDGLLAQMLMAAGYPLEIVEADRWRQDPDNAGLQGMALAEALQSQPWDISVKSLVAFPQILAVLDNNIEWTEELGEAFIAQQGEVMDRVQQLRSRAWSAHTLYSTPQQVVSDRDQSIEIAPADADTLYVPVYDPNLVFGNWPYPDNQPFDFDLPGYALGGFVGYVIVMPLWGWNHWDWHNHGLGVDGGPGAPGGKGGPGGPSSRPHRPSQPVPWRHDPAHRGSVPYRNPASQARYGNARVEGPGSPPVEFRGYPAARGGTPAPGPAYGTQRPSAPRTAPLAPQGGPAAQPGREARPDRAAPRSYAPEAPPRMQEPRPAPGPVVRPAPPALESFGHGPQVRMQEERGASSRQSAPAPAPPSHGNEHR